MTQPGLETDPIVMLRDMRKKLRNLLAATVAAYVVIGIVAFFAFSLGNTLREGTCNLRDDLEDRIHSSRVFLDKHPAGDPVYGRFGLSRRTVVESIENQERTRDALSNISC
jgi:hypothetical protein